MDFQGTCIKSDTLGSPLNNTSIILVRNLSIHNLLSTFFQFHRPPGTSSESTSSSDKPSASHMANSKLSTIPQDLPHWNFNNQNNQNVMASTVSKSHTMGPPPLVGSTETQSSSPVTENGRHKQNNTGVGKKATEPKSSRNPSAEKTVSFPGLINIMNMKPVKTNVSEDNDDDYDS